MLSSLAKAIKTIFSELTENMVSGLTDMIYSLIDFTGQ